MRVFVYEYLTALGLGRDPADPLHPMYREGRAMRDAVAEDFRALPGVEVVVDAADGCDHAVVIAPETDGVLDRLCGAILTSAGRLIGPSPEAIRLTSDKLALATRWRGHGVPNPATSDREPTACEAFPVVWKPRDGCGSTATFLLTSALDVTRAKAVVAAENHTGPMVLQEFVPGRAASVAFLCGPAGNVPLLPTFQHLSDDGRFHYRGGELPIPVELAARAVRLGARAISCIPGLLGYVGVDLVLGDAADGSKDSAIEVNPRLTTSYVGLRALADVNLAGAMLDVAAGRVPEMRWKPGRVRFAPDGTVQRVG
jgi:predicted ATP-grasp superfamily ATP-dependent carboligase